MPFSVAGIILPNVALNPDLLHTLQLYYGMPNVALFDIFIFLSDLPSLLLYILGFVFNIWPFLFYMLRFYSIFYDLYSIYSFIFIV